MGLFNFGSSKSTQQSQSQSSAYDASLNASLSDSFSRGGSQSLGQQTSSQSIAFEQLFAQLFGGATNAAAQSALAVPGLQDAAARLFSGGTGFLEQLQGNAGTDYLASRVTGPDQAAEAQLSALSSGLGDLFSEQLLPAITARGVATGTLGGSREAVAQSLAAKQVAGQYAQGAAGILGQSQASRDAAAAQLSGQTIAGAATGLSGLESTFGLAQAGAGASLSPYLALSQILGGPTVLTQQQGTSESSSFDVAEAISRAYGASIGGSQSTASSTAKSKGFSFGFSPSPGVS